MWRPIGQRAIGLIMAFGAGVLISGVAFELIVPALTEAEDGATGRLRSASAPVRSPSSWVTPTSITWAGMTARARRASGGSALALTLGIVLDGIPESIALGLTLLGGEGVSAAFLAAVFLSNLPESIAATSGFQKAGRSNRWVIGLWVAIVGRQRPRRPRRLRPAPGRVAEPPSRWSTRSRPARS